MRHVAINIQTARLSRGHTQASLARTLGLGLRTIQTWELGEALPNRSNLEALAAELDHTPAWFYAEHAEVPA